MRFLINTIITALALWITSMLLPGMSFGDGSGFSFSALLSLLVIAIVLGLINSIIAPVVKFLSLPITCLTLGIFSLVINAALLLFAGWVTSFLPQTLEFNSFWTAFFAAIIIGIISAILNWALGGLKSGDDQRTAR